MSSPKEIVYHSLHQIDWSLEEQYGNLYIRLFLKAADTTRKIERTSYSIGQILGAVGGFHSSCVVFTAFFLGFITVKHQRAQMVTSNVWHWQDLEEEATWANESYDDESHESDEMEQKRQEMSKKGKFKVTVKDYFVLACCRKRAW